MYIIYNNNCNIMPWRAHGGGGVISPSLEFFVMIYYLHEKKLKILVVDYITLLYSYEFMCVIFTVSENMPPICLV
jgi:hypothetical protein